MWVDFVNIRNILKDVYFSTKPLKCIRVCLCGLILKPGFSLNLENLEQSQYPNFFQMKLFKVANFSSLEFRNGFKKCLLENLEKLWNFVSPEKWEPWKHFYLQSQK